MTSAVSGVRDTATAWEAPASSSVRRAPARSAIQRWAAAGMLRSRSPNTNDDGISSHSGRARRLLERRLCHWTLRGCHQRGLGWGDVGSELRAKAVAGDCEFDRAVGSGDRLHVRLEGASREARGELQAALARRGGERGDVDECPDVAGVGIDVGDHGAAVRVGDEDDGTVDGADMVAQRPRVGSDAAQRVG